MVEVFKTDVIDQQDAERILAQIHEIFGHYQANFALDDCDKILRIKCLEGFICVDKVRAILADHGFVASVLVDDFQPSQGINLDSYLL